MYLLLVLRKVFLNIRLLLLYLGLAAFQIGLTNNHPRELEPVIGHYHVCVNHEQPLSSEETNEWACMGKTRFVIVQLKGDGVLTLCEVEVYGGMNSDQGATYTD